MIIDHEDLISGSKVPHPLSPEAFKAQFGGRTFSGGSFGRGDDFNIVSNPPFFNTKEGQEAWASWSVHPTFGGEKGFIFYANNLTKTYDNRFKELMAVPTERLIKALSLEVR